MTFVIFLWITLAALVGVFASHHYHRSALGYFGIALVASPLTGGLLVLALGPKTAPALAAGQAGGSAEGDNTVAEWTATTVIAFGVMAIVAMLRP
jgi:hypothetical protein